MSTSETKPALLKPKSVKDKICNKRPLLGGDPEFFITTKRGKTLSACQFLPSKFNKKKVRNYSGNKVGEYFFDGVQAEINIEPSRCREVLASRIWNVLRSVKSKIGDDYKVVMKPSVIVSKDVLDRADPEAKRFGCSPDWNAYTGLQNESKLNGDTHRVRYSGGHIHLSFDKGDRMLSDPNIFLDFVKLLDLFVGIPMLLLDVGSASNRRRKYYGKAGTFRETRWGVEYRQPSNVWLKSPELTSLALGLSRTAYRIMISSKENLFWDSVKQEEIRKAIDSSNNKDCTEIYERIKELMGQVSLSDDPFCNNLTRGGRGSNGKLYVAGSDIYDYVRDKTIDVVYGTDCEEAWYMYYSKLNRPPREIYRGFIDGTLDKIKRINKDDYLKLVNYVDN